MTTASLSLSPAAWAIFVSAGTEVCTTPFQRASAPRPLDACEIGPLIGVASVVIGACVSHGTFSSYGGRLPPGGSSGWTPSILLSDWPNSPGDSE